MVSFSPMVAPWCLGLIRIPACSVCIRDQVRWFDQSPSVKRDGRYLVGSCRRVVWWFQSNRRIEQERRSMKTRCWLTSKMGKSRDSPLDITRFWGSGDVFCCRHNPGVSLLDFSLGLTASWPSLIRKRTVSPDSFPRRATDLIPKLGNWGAAKAPLEGFGNRDLFIWVLHQ